MPSLLGNLRRMSTLPFSEFSDDCPKGSPLGPILSNAKFDFFLIYGLHSVITPERIKACLKIVCSGSISKGGPDSGELVDALLYFGLHVNFILYSPKILFPFELTGGLLSCPLPSQQGRLPLLAATKCE